MSSQLRARDLHSAQSRSRDDRALSRLRRLGVQGRDAEGELVAERVSAESLANIKAPAGLDISAITSEEIALSILAEMCDTGPSDRIRLPSHDGLRDGNRGDFQTSMDIDAILVTCLSR